MTEPLYTAMQMPAYTAITIIYNPNSTGSSKKDAHNLAARLLKKLPKKIVTIVPTEYAGHAELLAYELALASKHPLIISASGDGGYHEVVNGIMKAVKKGAHPVAGLLPSGNANDHYNHMHKRGMVTTILSGKADKIDLLYISGAINGKRIHRYAHSYAGIGITPHAAKHLNQSKLNKVVEVFITTRAILSAQPVTISINGTKETYYSLVMSNVNRMAKILTLSEKASVHDGKFEIAPIKTKRRIILLSSLARSAVSTMPSSTQATSLKFQTIKALPIQLDGELYTLDAHSTVTVTSQSAALPCVV